MRKQATSGREVTLTCFLIFSENLPKAVSFFTFEVNLREKENSFLREPALLGVAGDSEGAGAEHVAACHASASTAPS